MRLRARPRRTVSGDYDKARAGAPMPAGDAGFGLVETIVALVVLALVMMSTFLGVRSLISGAATDRLAVEAASYASNEIQYYQAQAEQDQLLPSTGTVTAHETMNGVEFTATVTFTAIAQESSSGSGLDTLCSLSSGSLDPLEIWDLAVKVTWPGPGLGKTGVEQHTQIAPAEAGAIDEGEGEIAVIVDDGLDSQPLDSPIDFSVAASWTGQSGDEPTGTTTSGSGNTGSDGCGVVPGLDPTAGWDYAVTLSDNPGWVSTTEQSDSNEIITGGKTVVNDPTETVGPLTAGEVTTTPTMYLAEGQTEALTFEAVSFSGAAEPASVTVPDVPVTVSSAGLTSGSYTFGNSSTPLSSLLLYPYPSGYSIWAGDSTSAEPTNSDSQPVSVPIDSSLTGGATIELPTLTTAVTDPAADSGDTLEAAEVGGSYSYSLGPVASPSPTPLPLGEYEITTASGKALSHAVYLWITPKGYYTSGSEMSSLPSGSPSTGTLSVTLS